MVAFLVQEGGLDIWTGVRVPYQSGRFEVDADGNRTRMKLYTLLPLHSAALTANRPDLTECGMPVNTCAIDSGFTPLHSLVMSTRNEMETLPVIQWLVEQKGADVMKRYTGGCTRCGGGIQRR